MTERARWLRFNAVGVAGFAVQMLTLAALERWFAVPAGVAVTVAVLAAVSHNFLWHEHVTWPGQPNEGRWRRWLSFNVSTGAVSVATNLIVTTIVAAATGASLLVSNVMAVVSASLVNFWVSDRAVFNRNTARGAEFPDRPSPYAVGSGREWTADGTTSSRADRGSPPRHPGSARTPRSGPPQWSPAAAAVPRAAVPFRAPAGSLLRRQVAVGDRAGHVQPVSSHPGAEGNRSPHTGEGDARENGAGLNRSTDT